MFPVLSVNYVNPLETLEKQTDDVILASLGWAEARGQIAKVSYLGPLAVMSVVMNRSKAWKKSVSEVILQSAVVGAQRIWQFSCWRHDDPRTPRKEVEDPNYTALLAGVQGMNRDVYDSCWLLALGLLNNKLQNDPTKGALHYYNPAISSPTWGRGNPKWEEHVVIGDHVFGISRN